MQATKIALLGFVAVAHVQARIGLHAQKSVDETVIDNDDEEFLRVFKSYLKTPKSNDNESLDQNYERILQTMIAKMDPSKLKILVEKLKSFRDEGEQEEKCATKSQAGTSHDKIRQQGSCGF